MCSAPVPDRAALANAAREIPGVIHVRELMRGRTNVHVVATGLDTSDINRIAHDLSETGLEIVDEALIQRENSVPYREFGPADEPIHTPTTNFRQLAGGGEVVEVTVSPGARVEGHTLESLVDDGVIPEEGLVVSIERDGEMLTPGGETVLRAGDVVNIFSRDPLGRESIQSFTEPRTDEE